MKNGIWITLAIVLLYSCTSEQKHGFLIVVDQASYNLAMEEVLAYQDVLMDEGLDVKIESDFTYHPDSIRHILQNHYASDFGLRGVVFIGDVPVAMLRNAQHLSTAFKMDQDRYPMWRSSIPSDRFYDDFDLKFDFIERDTAYANHFYFKLKAESSQSLHPDIYSGRIKIPNDQNAEKLKLYLRKVVEAHKKEEPIDKVLFFAGHGYNTESMIARMDEKIELLNQFPQLRKSGCALDFIDHSFEVHSKFKLLSSLNCKDLDVALLHHHGGIKAQYLNGTPKVSGVTQSIDNIQYYLRSKMESGLRRGKSKDDVYDYYGKWLDVPESWFDGALDKQQQREDSVFNANLDIYPKDLENFKTNVRFLMVDACFNGSFQKDEYMVANHVFNQGEIIAAQANSVNVIQDKFPNNMIGLLNNGIRVGEWNQMVCALETHIIGDPTFRFKQIEEVSYEEMLLLSDNMQGLRDLATHGGADEQCWALRMIYEKQREGSSDFLLDKYYSSEFGIVRMQAIKLLALINDGNFIKGLESGVKDPYELVRRTSVLLCGRSGHPVLAPAVVGCYINPGQSKRVVYQAKDALALFEKELLIRSLDSMLFAKDGFWDKAKVQQETFGLIEKSASSMKRYIDEITNDSATVKSKKFAVRALRNKNYHPAIETICKVLEANESEELSLIILEALAWFDHSYKKDVIIDACHKIKNGSYAENIKNEADRTINRLNQIQWN